MTTYEKYHLAKSIEDALITLKKAPGPSRIIAGGTDLLLDLQQGREPAVNTLVDITHVPELNELEIRKNRLFIGAAVPLSKITTNLLVCQHAQALAEATGLIGGPQVRNTGTLGGNVAHALPAADGTIALLALDAQAEIATLDGLRQQSLSTLFRGPGQSTLSPMQDLLVGFYLPLRRANQASAFIRIMRPQGVALPIINLAVWLQRTEDLISDLRVSVGPAGRTPQRAISAEDALRGQRLTPSQIDFAWQNLVRSMHFRTSPHRAGSEYRRHLAAYLLEEALNEAWNRTTTRSQEKVGNDHA